MEPASPSQRREISFDDSSKEDLLRQLRLLSRYENDPEMKKMELSTEKWKRAAQGALDELLKYHEGGSQGKMEVLDLFGIDANAIGLSRTT
ncbi:hypothetical protein CSKR_203145 [Clonorchis sinensis]|uniref:Uncharacterized protein n=1 Tax=Clonorchis sinensis TaxID=79923 RepID=A0A8T1M7V9_CLOSI|nr:hypothetical protein CSKR_203145 [Clonorchis sinensis]